jgi:hypothetical protein
MTINIDNAGAIGSGESFGTHHAYDPDLLQYVSSYGIEPPASWEQFPYPLLEQRMELYGDGTGGFGFTGEGVVTLVSPAVKLVIGSGGFRFGGVGIEGEVSPAVDLFVGSGGFQFCNASTIGEQTVTYPVTKVVQGSGGFAFLGRGIWYQTPPSAIATLLVTGKGGFAFGGVGAQTFPLPALLSLVGSGGFRMGGFRTDQAQFFLPTSLRSDFGTPGLLGFGGEGRWSFPTPAVLIIPSKGGFFGLGGAGVTSVRMPAVLLVTGEGGFGLLGTGLLPPGFDTWVLTGNAFEPSYYTNYDFNSFAHVGAQYFGAKDDGIYLLDGEDDDGQEIVPGVRIGPTNLGTANLSRIRAVNVGNQGPDARVHIVADDRERIFPVQAGKAWGSRDLQARELTIDIAGFDKLSHIEITSLTISWD